MNRPRSAPPAPGAANLAAAWWMISLSLAAGAVLGMWSFGGPIAPPAGFESPGDLPRRLVRLAHIAGVALPALNLLYVPWIRRARWPDRVRRTGCRLLLAGTLSLPPLLALAAFWAPALYALPCPVLMLISSCLLAAAGRPDEATTKGGLS